MRNMIMHEIQMNKRILSCRKLATLKINTLPIICIFMLYFVSRASTSSVGVTKFTKQFNVTHPVGNDAVMTCTVKGIGNRKVIWRKSSDVYPLSVGTSTFASREKYHATHSRDDWRLVIKNLQYSDAGEYQCLITGDPNGENKISLVIPGNDQTHLLSTETRILAGLGSSAILPCRVHNLRKHMVLWQKHSGLLISLRRKVHSSTEKYRLKHSVRSDWNLEIRDMQEEDYGIYVCVVNTVPTLTRTVHLAHTPATEPVNKSDDSNGQRLKPIVNNPQHITDNFLDNVVAQQHQSVNLTCRFSGDPTPIVKWERRIWSRHGIKEIQYTTSVGEQYQLVNAQPSDAGIYVCKATNGVPPPGQAKISVFVQEMAAISTEAPVTIKFDPYDEAPPKVVSVESSVMAPLGIDTELACRAIGIPRPFVQWHKNGILVNDSYKYEQLSFTYRHHTTLAWLRIRSLSRKDFGQYVCMASNDFGKQETTIILAEKRRV